MLSVFPSQIIKVHKFPAAGERLVIPLVSLDRSEEFLLDATRSRIDFSKITYQSRTRIAIVLLRLDLNGPPHRNPDDALIPCPHLHIYREGYGDKWAFPVPPQFMHLDDMLLTFTDFLAECNVVEPPLVQSVLF